MYKPLPIGVDSFRDIITNGYYYVDKTLWIKELLDLKGASNLFTRPRRFGKTLNLSMLRYFFEDTGDEKSNAENRALFDGLQIMKAGTPYTDRMGQYPVISLTLKSSKQGSFEEAYFQICEAIRVEFGRHRGILDSIELDAAEKERYQQLLEGRAEREVVYTSLRFLTECLYKATGKRTIILIDEYDVPLENAFFRGFYREMVDCIRSLLESALKTNECVEFSVITGCFRISKETIFTGLNHLEINTILSNNYSEYFGFLPKEVNAMLSAYGCPEKMVSMQEWYDGYSFGQSEIYNPWSVIKYVKDICANENALPIAYWINTSSNDIVKNLVEHAGNAEREQIESLIAGGSIDVPVHEELTYEDMDQNGDALWNFLFFTGYLTKTAEWLREGTMEHMVRLVIPNIEVRQVYQRTVLKWFREQLETEDFQDLYRAMEQGDTGRMQEILNTQLQRTISFYDSAENFYHGFLVGVLGQNHRYHVKYNRETGAGRSDIMVYPLDLERTAYVLELKASNTFRETSEDARKAVTQIEEKHYTAELQAMGYEQIECYGIAFYRKNCKVVGSDR